MIRRIVPVLYLLVGVVVASQHHYLHAGSLGQILSAVLAILLWPLVLLGISLVIR